MYAKHSICDKAWVTALSSPLCKCLAPRPRTPELPAQLLVRGVLEDFHYVADPFASKYQTMPFDRPCCIGHYSLGLSFIVLPFGLQEPWPVLVRRGGG